MKPPLVITPQSPEESELWSILVEIVRLFDRLDWVLVGAQMVIIIEREHGFVGARTTRDIDALVNASTMTGGTAQASRLLLGAGFEPEPTMSGAIYRFARGPAIVDVLAPDHLGVRATRLTVPPAETIEAAGGRQALRRKRVIVLDVAGELMRVPIPSLAGALVMKEAASRVTNDPKHLGDVARLLALVTDVEAVRAKLTNAERRQLRQHRVLGDSNDLVWAGVANAEEGLIAFERITEP